MSQEAPGSLQPEDPLVQFLGGLVAAVPVASIDAIWIFPTREAGKSRSTVAVLSAFEPDPTRRRVITAQRVLRPDAKGRMQPSDSILEHGSTPADRVERIVEGVLRRLEDETASAPRRVEIAGEPGRWDELLASLFEGS